jgi:hypothetical protein
MVNQLKENAGALTVKYEEIDINPREIGRDEKGYMGLWVIAHEYRHALQFRRNASVFNGNKPADAPNTSLRSYLALHRAMEADSNAFAATCLYEVLVSERLSPLQIAKSMEGTVMARIMSVQAQPRNLFQDALQSGHIATHAFDAFFHPSNKKILCHYDARLLDLFKPFSCVEDDDKKSPDGFTARFNAMKTMPYLSDDGAAIERKKYLEEIDFPVLKTLPHFSLRNRLHRLMLLSPFGS